MIPRSGWSTTEAIQHRPSNQLNAVSGKVDGNEESRKVKSCFSCRQEAHFSQGVWCNRPFQTAPSQDPNEIGVAGWIRMRRTWTWRRVRDEPCNWRTLPRRRRQRHYCAFSVEQLDDSKEERSAFIWYNTETARLTIANDILLSLYRGTMCSIVTGFVSGIWHGWSFFATFTSGELVWHRGNCSAVDSFLSVWPIPVGWN